MVAFRTELSKVIMQSSIKSTWFGGVHIKVDIQVESEEKKVGRKKKKGICIPCELNCCGI